jgi:DnaJ-domain-containing protein 1
MQEAQRLFYHCTLVVGAQIAMADGNPDSSELKQLKEFFKIDPTTLPEAATIYNGQLHNPMPLELALKPYRDIFHERKEMGETFLYGMCLVTKANGKIHTDEIKLLTNLAKLIGLDTQSMKRVFVSARVAYDKGSEADPRSKQDERTKHLVVLGLLSNSSQREIREEYKRLTKRYHPDILRSQGLPEAEIRHAEDLLKEIITAHEWLTTSRQN